MADDADKSGIAEGMEFTVHALTNAASLGVEGGDDNDQIHQISIKIPIEKLTGKLDLLFEVNIDEENDNTSAGIDELRIISYRGSCTVDCDGTMVVFEDFNGSEDESSWGKVTKFGDGHVILGPLQGGEKKIEKVFPMSPVVASAQIEFVLYEIDNWEGEGDDANKFEIQIGSLTFDLALTLFADEDEEVGGYASGDVGANGEIHWDRVLKAKDADLGIGTDRTDKIHKVTIDVDSSLFVDESIYISFNVIGDSQAAAGIDDYKIFVFPDKEACAAVKEEKEELVSSCALYM